MPKLTFRQANENDIKQIVDIIIGDPNQLTTKVGMKLYSFTEISQARRLFTVMAKATENWRTTTLAEMNNEVVGILQVSGASLRMTPGLFITAVLLYGPFFMRKLMPRIQIQKRIQTYAPENAYKIAELHVAPSYRRQGIGGQLLTYAEKDARATNHSLMALQTWTNNPAKMFYEHFGFTVTDTKTDDEFERLTGATGNYLMIKELL